LLAKWLFKLLNEEGLWQDAFLRRKYMRNKNLSQAVKNAGDSHFWMGPLEVKDLFLEKGGFKVINGNQTRFWEDLWIGGEPLMLKYPALYNIVRRKSARVASVLGSSPLGMKMVRKPLNCFLLLHLNTKTKAKAVKPDTKTNTNLRNIENFENKLIRAELCRTRSVYEKLKWNIDLLDQVHNN